MVVSVGLSWGAPRAAPSSMAVAAVERVQVVGAAMPAAAARAAVRVVPTHPLAVRLREKDHHRCQHTSTIVDRRCCM